MLWYKGWLETRWRLAFGLFVFSIFLLQTRDGVDSAPGKAPLLLNVVAFLTIFVAVLQAGAGIKTQTTFRTVKGIHGSMHFTLSLPVSRARLVAVRAGLGFLQMAVAVAALSAAVCSIVPGIHASAADAAAYALTLIAGGSGFYCLSVLLSTFLDDLWQMYGSLIAIGLLKWLSTRVSLPVPLDIFRALTEGSPLVTHQLPWAALGVGLAMAAILYVAAVKVAEAREY